MVNSDQASLGPPAPGTPVKLRSGWNTALVVIGAVVLVIYLIYGLILASDGNAAAGQVLGLGFGGLGIYLLFLGCVPAGQALRMMAARTVPLGEVDRGFLEIKGQVFLLPDAPKLLAPGSNKPCAAYHWVREELRRGNKGRYHWAAVKREQRQIPFGVDDGSGQICIDPQNRTSLGPLPFKETVTESGSVRFQERRLDAGDSVYALGPCEDGPAGKIMSPQGVFDPFFFSAESEANATAGRLGAAAYLIAGGAQALLLALIAYAIFGGA